MSPPLDSARVRVIGVLLAVIRAPGARARDVGPLGNDARRAIFVVRLLNGIQAYFPDV
jgi:hypothetical protein